MNELWNIAWILQILWIIFFRLLYGDYSSCWCSYEVQSEIKRTLNILWAYPYFLVETVLIFRQALFCRCIYYVTYRHCDRWRYQLLAFYSKLRHFLSMQSDIFLQIHISKMELRIFITFCTHISYFYA